MRATFRGCIHPYTGRSVDQLLVLKQETKNRACRSMRGPSAVGVQSGFIMWFDSPELSRFLAGTRFPFGERWKTKPRAANLPSRVHARCKTQFDRVGLALHSSLFWLRCSDMCEGIWAPAQILHRLLPISRHTTKVAPGLSHISSQGSFSFLSLEFARLISLKKTIFLPNRDTSLQPQKEGISPCGIFLLTLSSINGTTWFLVLEFFLYEIHGIAFKAKARDFWRVRPEHLFILVGCEFRFFFFFLILIHCSSSKFHINAQPVLPLPA